MQKFLVLLSALKFDEEGLGSTWHLGGIYACPLKFDSVHKNRYLEPAAKLEKSEDKWLAAAAFHGKTRSDMGNRLPTVWHKSKAWIFFRTSVLELSWRDHTFKTHACWGWGNPNRMDPQGQRLKGCHSRSAGKYASHVIKQWSGTISVKNVWRYWPKNSEKKSYIWQSSI